MSAAVVRLLDSLRGIALGAAQAADGDPERSWLGWLAGVSPAIAVIAAAAVCLRVLRSRRQRRSGQD